MMDLTYLAPGSENVSQMEYGAVMKPLVQVMYSFVSIKYRCFSFSRFTVFSFLNLLIDPHDTLERVESNYDFKWI